VVSFTPRLLYPQGKNTWYPLDRRLNGPQSRSGNGGEKNSQTPPGLEPPIVQPVAQRYATEISQLLNRNAYEVLVGQSEGELPFGNEGVNGMVILKQILGE
jgi:hypothetical protein